MRKSLIAGTMLAVSVAIAPACATKKFVRTEVGNVNTKVDTLSTTLEQTQGRIQQDEARIGEVDKKAEAAGTAAQAAQNSANQAAQAAQQVNGRVEKVQTELTANVAAGRRLMYEVTLSEDQGNFKFGAAELPDAAKMRLDQLVGELKGQTGKDLYIEVEGYTDNVGSQEGNYNLGLERAEVVKRYLVMQHQVPLHKINVISYGEEKPVAPNNTRAGRAQNRRVVVRILS